MQSHDFWKRYGFYVETQKTDTRGDLYRREIRQFIAEHSVPVREGMDMLAKILRCVFFDGVDSVDRRRISAYGIVIRAAIQANVPPAGLAAFNRQAQLGLEFILMPQACRCFARLL